MKCWVPLAALFALFVLALIVAGAVAAQGASPQDAAGVVAVGTTFTYQGHLIDGSSPADGKYDFRFRLYAAPDGGSQVGSTVYKDDVTVTDGRFAVDLDFGDGSFTGDTRYLEIGVRPGDSTGSYTDLAPRQAIRPAPYSMYAGDADRLDGVEADGFLRTTGGAVSGNVAIGATAYPARLHVQAGDHQRALYIGGGATVASSSLSSKWNLPTTGGNDATLSVITGDQDTNCGFGFINGTNVSSPVVWMYNYSDRNAFTVAKKTYTGSGSDISGIDDALTPLFQVRVDGRVGIGTTDPGAKLHLYSSSTSEATVLEIEGTVLTPTLHLRRGHHDWSWINDGSGLRAVLGTGDGTDPNFAIRSDGRVSLRVLQITGGSDLAEPFEVVGAENVEPGMVVAIDPEHPGQLRIADRAYDRMVAGCVSGANGVNPGLVMEQEGTAAGGTFPVALSGRVYCWADASYGPIRPGDLLTTSDTPGYAMRVGDYDQAQGAILGKAMSSLEKGRGLVLVLVTLQ